MTAHDSIEDDQDSQPEQVSAVSKLLIEAREAKGLSQKEVAEQLYLTVTFIRYIDEGAFDKIPKPAFIKGYLRSYARVVGLDGDAVIEAYNQEQSVVPQAPQIGNLAGESIGTGSITGPVAQTGVVGLIVIVIVVALVWWLGAGDAPPPVVKQPGIVAAPAGTIASGATGEDEDHEDQDVHEGDQSPGVDPTAIDVTPLPYRDASIVSGEARLTPEAAAISAAPEVESVPSAASEEEQTITEVRLDPGVEIDRVRDGQTQYITVYGGGDGEMEFVFSNECWVQIKDAGNNIIYRDLNRGGDVMTVYGNAPFEVLLGKASVVQMTYQGNPIELARLMTSDQTAIVRTARL